jgi:hypothetical protein
MHRMDVAGRKWMATWGMKRERERVNKKEQKSLKVVYAFSFLWGGNGNSKKNKFIAGIFHSFAWK